jgi:glycosyltransferase involved in cell wall biosynthesis
MNTREIHQHILIIGSVWPEPSSSAAGSRLMQLIELFQTQNWKVTFACAAAESDFMVDVELLGIKKVNIKLNHQSFDETLKELQPTIVMFDRFMTEEQFGWRVAESCPDALRVIDTIDLHCLRHARQTAFREKRTFSSMDLNNDIAKREIASIYRSDLSIIISEFEMKLLDEFFKVDIRLLHYLPFMLEKVDSSEWRSFSESKNFVTIGNFLHEPNWNSVQFLKDEIWPLIRKKLPKAELHIYGAYPSQKVNSLSNPKEGFYIHGRAESARKVIEEARVLLAPLRFGAGLKGKLVEAMQFGTPSVTTDIGAEAMHGKFEWNGIIANDPAKIADAAVELYLNEALWERSRQNGIKIINELYQKEIPAKEFIERLSALQQDLPEHRHNNFTGAMLMHHTISGTKYMSKWIEEKNKIL